MTILILAAACTGGGSADTASSEPYVAQSAYLADPTLNLELVVDTAAFLAKARDEVDGGFHIYVDDAGDPVFPDESWWGTTECEVTFDHHLKPVFGQSRVAYAFSKAFMVTGDEAWLDHAEHALAFLYEHGWDEQHGGWYFTTDAQGELAPWLPCDTWDPNDWKWIFSQVYPLLGIAALTEATLGASTGTSEHWQQLAAGLDVLDEHMWDDRAGYLGYYENADLDWANPEGKGFTGAADGITTHAATLYLQTGDPAHGQRVLDLADTLVERLVPTIPAAETAFGFAEAFDSDWQIDRSETGGFVGHLLKAAWCLARAYAIDPRPEYLEAAEVILDEVWNEGGYDHDFGGPFQDFDWQTGEVVQGKNFWNVEQGFTGGITTFHHADDEGLRSLALEMADESLDFYMTKLRDPAVGVSYTSTENDGTPDDTQKGHLWKAGYHDAELGYLAYVYGSLYVTGEPVSLHYRVVDDGMDHSMVLSPVEDAGLVITAVELDGAPYDAFDGASRLLEVPAGVGGAFEVTFELP